MWNTVVDLRKNKNTRNKMVSTAVATDSPTKAVATFGSGNWPFEFGFVAKKKEKKIEMKKQHKTKGRYLIHLIKTAKTKGAK